MVPAGSCSRRGHGRHILLPTGAPHHWPQELAREHDKALRSTRAKLQRTESELRGAKQVAADAAARLSELESLNAKKDLQLDAAAQQVGLMQHELEALRQGLSNRQAAMLEAARSEFAAALDGCRADLEASRSAAAAEAQRARVRGAALARVAAILAVHASDAAAPPVPAATTAGAGSSDTCAAPEVDPDTVVAIVEAVSGSVLDASAQWEAEKAAMGSALEAAEAVQAQLEALLAAEREEGRSAAAEAARAAAALEAAQQQLLAAEVQLKEMEGARTARTAAEAALESCRGELSAATARAAAAADDCAKWQGTASALELAAGKAQAAAQAAQAAEDKARAEAAAKEERIRELRAAMAGALEDKSCSQAALSALLLRLQAACGEAAGELARVEAVLGGCADPGAAALAAALTAAGRALRSVPGGCEVAAADLEACGGALAGALGQLVIGYVEVTGVLEERQKVRGRPCSMLRPLNCTCVVVL